MDHDRNAAVRSEDLAAVPASATGVVVIDLAAIADNWRGLQRLVDPAIAAAVVKADAYGLGADRVIPALAAAGASVFFVATLEEALQARTLAPRATVMILDGVPPGAAEDILASGAWPVLSSLPEVRDWAALAGRVGRRLPAVLHVDCGLNRLGLSGREVQALAADMHVLDALDVRLVMSHMACADEPGHPKNVQQLAVFSQLLPLLPTAPASFAASDGLMLGPEFHFGMVRPGYALYGGQAAPGRGCPVRPVVSVQARVLQVRDVAPGQTVGYAATYSPSHAARIAVIAGGYADGLPRHLSAASGQRTGWAAFGGRRAPIVGRVSMDLVTLDVSEIVDPSVARGDWAELVGPSITLEEMGATAGTIGYEILTRLGHRFHRLYLDGT
ncbi:MAG: alanine racemase [Hyphomicrobiaceae bacterium]|nr:alanine racemase [Hyphomicrobiaceae bacterium]